MVRGIQTAAQGMIAQMTSQEVTANNLANASTPGYKRDVAGFGVALSKAIGGRPGAVKAYGGVDLHPGALEETGNRFSLAIEGEGFFAVQTKTGTAYTRDGSFTLSPDGYLSTQSGERVMGTSGPVRLNGNEWRVDDAGRITQGGRTVATLQIARFPKGAALAKVGGNLWTSTMPPQADTASRVRQGFLEGSNVNTVGEMVSMIAGFRTYEASQKAVQAQDETLDRLVNDVGRVG